MCIRDRRQAVPLLTPQAPVVGTGMEYKVATDSGNCVLAKNAGEVIRSGDSGNWWFHHKYANLFFCKDSSEKWFYFY